ncbi:MAG: hypothetical protein PW788_02200 [Micavibrio sp.]|nr:hypothetical protein [Micavibrio sp.]
MQNTTRNNTRHDKAPGTKTPAPALKADFEAEGRADAAATEADDERRLESELEQLLNMMGTLTSCAPEVQAQNDEQVRTLMLSLTEGAMKQEKFKREAQETAGRKKPLAETRIKTRKPRYRMKKQSRFMAPTDKTSDKMQEFLNASQPLVTACVAAAFAEQTAARRLDCRSAAEAQAPMPRPLPA